MLNKKRTQKLISYFFVGSLIGWLIDTLYRTITSGEFSEGGALSSFFGFLIPLLPVYGIGLVTVYWFTQQKISFTLEKSLLLFIMFALVFTILEFGASFIVVGILENPLWNYSGQPIDLVHSIYWGLLGIISYKVIIAYG